jgi:hypothetical protein
MRCNCENARCRVCQGRGCHNEAGATRAMYVGPICAPCADEMPSRYLLPPEEEPKR